MSHLFPELDGARVTVGVETRERHQTAIVDALRLARSRRRSPRLRLLAIGLAGLLLIPVMALASDGAAPGDFLYPVKRVLEPVITVFDTDVVRQHRVEEVEELFDRAAEHDVIRDSIAVARDAVSPQDTRLSRRVDYIESELDRIGPSDDPGSNEEKPALTDRPKSDTTQLTRPPTPDETTTTVARDADSSLTGSTVGDDDATRGRDGKQP